ncbi:MAG TPA: hypothetical protein VMR02_01845 [Terracidiphilus sp.]|jgi:hypothetical protein|nr:hypothetical protein [Terracidiphilus sp.]
MPCKLDIATEVKQDILDCDAAARRQIGDFLLQLQNNPLPENRQPISGSSFYVQLPCGFYLSWEIIGDLIHFALTGKSKELLVRVLGVARVPPP